jgi:hypothetical protein
MILDKVVEVLGAHLQREGGTEVAMAQVEVQLPQSNIIIVRAFQEKIKKFLPGGSSSGGKQAILVLIILGFVWLREAVT